MLFKCVSNVELVAGSDCRTSPCNFLHSLHNAVSCQPSIVLFHSPTVLYSSNVLRQLIIRIYILKREFLLHSTHIKIDICFMVNLPSCHSLNHFPEFLSFLQRSLYQFTNIFFCFLPPVFWFFVH